MNALAGGAADKAGGRYEHLWTALRVADLLEGTASRIRLEPPGEAGVGIEFEVDIDGLTWGEQTKDHARPWTITRLKSEGVLAAARRQISLGRGFRLITASAAASFDSLSARARVSDTKDEFSGQLTDELTPEFRLLAKHWSASDEEAWRLLKRVAVQPYPLDSLRRTARAAYQVLYAGDPDPVIAEVRSFCDEHVHETVTAPQVAAHLKRKGFKTRLLAHDGDVRRGLERTVERQQRRVDSTTPAFGLVARPEVDQIVAALLDREGPQLTVVDGPAGFGKTAVVTEVATRLQEHGHFVAVTRMDADSAMSTSQHLGQHSGLSESPAIVLAGVADGSPALLIVDQLDAVSQFSGRMPDSFDAVEDVLGEISRAHNLKLLLVCRTVDLENDPRLRQLVGTDRAVRHTLAKLDPDHVRRHLAANDIHMPEAATLELLRVPLHLAIFDRLSEEGRRQGYDSLQSLYDQLTRDVRGRAERRASRLDWSGITSALVTHMSENESLVAPRALLDPFSENEVRVLESEGVIVGDERSVSFFHETYFDYLFARSFVHDGGDLHAFLARSGQFLFRRAQTRQVLEHLAGTDRSAFRNVATQLLASDHIRAHLKHVVVAVLSQVEPTAEDWLAIEPVAWADASISRFLLALLSDPRWFDAADANGRWEQWLADGDRVDRAAHQLVFAARKRPERVAELVRPYVGASEDWWLRLRALVAWSPSSALTPLILELVEGGHVDDARGPIAANSDFWSIVFALAKDDPKAAAQVIGAFLRRGLDRAMADGQRDPFTSGHLAGNSPSGEVIRDVANKAANEFVASVLPFVVDVALGEQRERPGMLPGGRWSPRHRGSAYGVDWIVFAAVEEALEHLAKDEPARAADAIADLRDHESDELRFLACRTLTALDDADDAVRWLLSDDRNFILGWADSMSWASRELIEAHSSRCSRQLFAQLEEAILAAPSRYQGPDRGHDHLVLLSVLDRNRMSERARRQLGELERRFPQSPPPEPRPGMASIVGSPIGDDASHHMSDENWLSALRKHVHDRTRRDGYRPVGGAAQLAQVLGRRAGEAPLRFARLALRFDSRIPPAAMAQVIRAIRSAVDAAVLIDVCEHAAGLYGEDIGREICSAAQALEAVDERWIALLERYAQASDPEQEWACTDSGSGEPYDGGDLYTAGINSTRGEAALAVATALFAGPVHVDRLLPLVENLAVDRSLAVRTCAAEAVVALLNHDSDRALDTAERLFDAPVDIHDAPTSERLLTHSLLRAPERFAPHLKRVLEGSPSVSKRGGHTWAVACFNGTIGAPLTDDMRSLPAPARLGVAEAFAQDIEVTYHLIAPLFDDPDDKVRKASAWALRDLTDVPPEALDGLVTRFADSAAFAEHMNDVLAGLNRLGTKLPPSTLRVCRLAVEAAGPGLGDITSDRSLAAGDLASIVMRLYRQGDESTRKGCLDLIDRLTEVNAHDIDRVLQEER